MTATLMSLVFAFLIGEIAVRLFYPQPDPILWIENSDIYGYQLKKNFHQSYRFPRLGYTMEVQINSLGLRDREFTSSELTDPKITRILLLGDSFTFGHALNVEDIFDMQLEEILRSRGDSAIVINAGVGGWGTLQEVLFASNNLRLFNPDFIVLSFCGNDPHDDLKFSNGLIQGVEGSLSFPGKLFLRDHSHLFRLVLRNFAILYHNFRLNQRQEGEKLDLQSASTITEEDWRRTRATIGQLQSAFRSHNPRGILLLQATGPENEDIRQHLMSTQNGKDIFYVDLHDDFTAIPMDSLLIPIDGHWNRKGHRISATRLADQIQVCQEERLQKEGD